MATRTERQRREFDEAVSSRCGASGGDETACSCACGRKPVQVGWVGETSYEELQDKPTINGVEILGDQTGNYYGLANLTDVKNGTLTLKDSDGNVLGTFTANQDSDVIITVSAGSVAPGNGKLTLKKTDGTVLGTFTANQTADTDITVATTEPGNGRVTLKNASGTSLGSFTVNQTTDTDVSLPPIPDAANNGVLTLKKTDGTVLGSFSANQATNTDITVSTTEPGNGKLTIFQNATSAGEFTANQGTDTSMVFVSPDWRETDSNAASFIRNKPDLSALNPVTPGTTTLEQLCVQYNLLLAALKGTTGGYDFSSLPTLLSTHTQAVARDAINLTITIATPMGGMPSVLTTSATDADLRTTFNALKAAIQAAGHYDVSSVADLAATDTDETLRTLFNAMATILKSHT